MINKEKASDILINIEKYFKLIFLDELAVPYANCPQYAAAV